MVPLSILWPCTKPHHFRAKHSSTKHHTSTLYLFLLLLLFVSATTITSTTIAVVAVEVSIVGFELVYFTCEKGECVFVLNMSH